MNKKLLYGISAFVIAAVSVFNLNFNSQKSHLSDMALANVEVLAAAENLPEVVITCSYPPSCHGKQCYIDIWNLLCPCFFNGHTYSFCAL
jgi:hypothetical protein